MKKTLFLFIITVMGLFGTAVGSDTNPYQRFIKNVQYIATANSGTLVIAELSDSTKWKMDLDINDDDILVAFEECMQPGKEVLIDVNLNTKYFRLNGYVDQGNIYSFLVSIDKETLRLKNSFPFLEKQEKILIKKGEQSDSDVYEHRYTLSDGSVWKTNYPAYKWNAGNKILISKEFFSDERYFTLINLDAPLLTYNDSIIDCRFRWLAEQVKVVTSVDQDSD